MEIFGTSGPTLCLLICLVQPPAPTVVNNYADECRVINPSRSDTAETLRQVARENARCRAAKGKGKK